MDFALLQRCKAFSTEHISLITVRASCQEQELSHLSAQQAAAATSWVPMIASRMGLLSYCGANKQESQLQLFMWLKTIPAQDL
jgi:hypothetical protein